MNDNVALFQAVDLKERETVNQYFNLRSITLQDLILHQVQPLPPAVLAKKLGWKGPPPLHTVGVWMPGQNDHGDALFLHKQQFTNKIVRDRASPDSDVVPSDIILMRGHDWTNQPNPPVLITTESFVKGMVAGRETRLPVVAKNGMDGWSNAQYWNVCRWHGPRIYICNDSLPEDSKKRAEQLASERREAMFYISEYHAEVFIVRLPPPPNSVREEKWGLDDYYTFHARRGSPPDLKKLLDKATQHIPPAPHHEFDPQSARADFTTNPPPEPEFIIEDFLPNEVGVFNGIGGTGKTTTLIDMSAGLILGEPYIARKINRPGPVLFITGEDDKPTVMHILSKICFARNLTPEQTVYVQDNFYVEDVSAEICQLVEGDLKGNIQPTSLADKILALYRSLQPSLVIFDPLANFGPGERFVNDGLFSLMIQARYLRLHMNCAVLFSSHLNKADSVRNDPHAYASRGGAVTGDKVRCEMQLTHISSHKAGLPPTVTKELFGRPGVLVYELHIHKQSRRPKPLLPFILVREGFKYTYHPHPLESQTQEAIEKASQDAKETSLMSIIGFLVADLSTVDPVYYTKSTLKAEPAPVRKSWGGLTQRDVEMVVDYGLAKGHLIETEIPHDKVRGQKTHYLRPAEKHMRF